MLKISMLFIAVLLAGCGSTRISPSNVEHCSLQGKDLYPSGVATSHGTSVAGSYVNGRYVSSEISSSHQSVMCSRPANKYEKCLSRKLQRSGRVIYDYNEGSGVRRGLTGLGYITMIWPGLIGMYVNNSNNEKKMREVASLRNSAFEYCEKYKPEEERI